MNKSEEIKQRINKIKSNFNDFRMYLDELEELENEMELLNTIGRENLSVSQIMRLSVLEEKKPRLERIANQNTIDFYPRIAGECLLLNEFILSCMQQEIINDKGLVNLKQEYAKTERKLLQLTIDHNNKFNNKLDSMKKELEKIGYFELINDVGSNHTAGVLGMYRPSTTEVKNYHPDVYKLKTPDKF